MNAELTQFDFIFGADGASSVVRKQMQELKGIESRNQFIDCGYKHYNNGVALCCNRIRTGI